MFHVLTKNDEFVGVILTDAYTLNLSECSIHELDNPIPDLNRKSFDGALGDWVTVDTTLTKLDFLSRFTIAERITARSSTDPIVVDIMGLFDAAETISTTNPITQQSVDYFVTAGILTETRASEILNGSS